MTLTTMMDRLAEDLSQALPADGLDHATAAVVETCDVQLGWSFAPDADAAEAAPAADCRGSAIALTSPDGTWLLIALCDRRSALSLTRALFAMDDDEEVLIEDTADALNEIMNVAAGVFKSQRDERGEKLCIGLPTYLDGDDGFCGLSDPGSSRSRTIRTADGVCLRVIAFWREGADHGRLHA